MNTMTTHQGGCHCGAVTYRATVDLEKVLTCNCSHCSAKGFMLSFTPANQFQLLTGQDALTEYRFNKKAITHLFCSTCGVQPFGRAAAPDGQEMVAVNVRTLEGVDLDALEPARVDGRSF